MVKEIDAKINEIDNQIEELKKAEVLDEAQLYVLKRQRHDLVKMCKNIGPHDKVFLARHKKRPKITEYIDNIFPILSPAVESGDATFNVLTDVVGSVSYPTNVLPKLSTCNCAERENVVINTNTIDKYNILFIPNIFLMVNTNLPKYT